MAVQTSTIVALIYIELVAHLYGKTWFSSTHLLIVTLFTDSFRDVR